MSATVLLCLEVILLQICNLHNKVQSCKKLKKTLKCSNKTEIYVSNLERKNTVSTTEETPGLNNNKQKNLVE